MKRSSRDILLRIALAIAIVGGVLCTLVDLVLKDRIIIQHGVRLFMTVRNFTVVVAIIGWILVAVFGIPKILAKLRQGRQERQEKKSQSDYADDSTNPILNRRRLRRLERDRPEFKDITDRCYEQMDLIDTIQYRLKGLMEWNKAIYLQDVLDALDSIERDLCWNIRNIINLCETASNRAHLDMAKVNEFYQDGAEKLELAQRALEASTDWVNNYDAHQLNGRSRLDILIKEINKTSRGLNQDGN